MKFSDVKSKASAAVIVTLSLALTVVLYLYSLPHKAGISPDSVIYLSSANHLFNRKGLYTFLKVFGPNSHPLIEWPFMVQLIMVFFMFFKVHPAETGWVMNLCLFSLNLSLAAFIVLKATRSVAWSLVPIAFFIFSESWRTYHVWILSEPLFIFLIGLLILSLVSYLKTGKFGTLILAAFFASAVVFTRYVGVAYIGAGCLALFVLVKGKFSRRIAAAFWYGLASSIPVIIWLIRNYLRANERFASDDPASMKMFGTLVKDYVVPNKSSETFYSSFKCIHHWVTTIIPAEQNLLIILLCSISLLMVLWTLFRSFGMARNRSESALILWVSSIFTITYYLTLNFSLIFSKFYGQVPDRYLFPAFTTGAICLAVAAGMWVKNRKSENKIVRSMMIFLPFVLITAITYSQMENSVKWLHNMKKLGADRSEGKKYRSTLKERWLPEDYSPKEMAVFNLMYQHNLRVEEKRRLKFIAEHGSK